jgi:hypothetical protein
MDKKTTLIAHDITKWLWPGIARHYVEDNIGVLAMVTER